MEVTRPKAWPPRPSAFVWGLTLALAGMAPRTTAHADAISEARTTFERGVEASRALQWDEARTQFGRSLELLPKASTMFNLAVTDIKLGLGREALEQLDAFEHAASHEEHAQMLARAAVLRPQAQALVDSAQATAQRGGNVLSETDERFTDEVRQQVQQARADYGRGHDREALQGFERAYESSGRAALLYNIGVVADRLRDDQKAARAYDQFVAALPDAPEAAVAQVRSDALHRTLAERESVRQSEQAVRFNTAAPSPGRSDSAPAQSLRKPRVLVVTGTMLAVGGVVSTAVSGRLYSVHNPSYEMCFGDPDCNNKDEVRGDRNAMVAGVALGATAAAMGLVLVTVGAVQLSHRKSALAHALGRVAPSLAAAPDGAVLSLSGRF
jgi:tetratricopeptide (TPR) repeat protein